MRSGMHVLALALLLVSGIHAPLAAKDHLVLALKGEPGRGFDPTMGWGESGSPLFHATLLTRDAALGTRPDLATRWSLSEDGTLWSIEIRAGITFSDGAPLKASDVAFTFRQALESGGLADVTGLVEAKALDDTHLTLRLKAPRITFQNAFFTLGIVPEKGYSWDYGQNPVGSGPYRLVRWDKGQQLIVERNPRYHGIAPAFAQLTFLFTGEDATWAAAQAGKLDIAAIPNVMAERAPPSMKRVVVRTVDNRGLMFPMRAQDNPVTADLAIRRAINLALDRASLAKLAAAGFATPANGPADGLPWDNPEAILASPAPDAAKSLLDEAGWALAPSGVRTRDGIEARLRLLYPAHDLTRQFLALGVQSQLKDIGIHIEPMGLSLDKLRKEMHRNVVLFGWGSHSPREVYHLYASSMQGQAYFNAGHYANTAVDEALEAAERAGSLEASYPLWRKAAWNGTTGFGSRGDAAWAWLVNLDHVYLVNPCLDLGPLQVEPHGHGWPITAGLAQWRWNCP